jgi:putative flavoprotein involved in K+ transport
MGQSERNIETVIVGGGQAGLAVSYYLGQQGHEHVILEQADRPAHTWRDDRWDSFTFVTPNWTIRLPGQEYQGPNPDGYLDKEEIVRIFDRYAEKYSLPLEFNVRVTSVDAQDSGYRVQTSNGEWHARNVVIATGVFQTRRIPEFSKELPAGVFQTDSGQYRNPQKLPPGAVLVVGSGQSGCQICEELYQAGRQVYQCVGSAGRAPRRYRGKDIVYWLDMSGFFSRTVANLPNSRARFAGNPQVSGKNGGHSLNLHQFYRDGVHLLGRITGFQDGSLLLAPDLKENLDKNDQAELRIIHTIDEYITRNGISAPEESLPAYRDGYDAPEILSLNLKETGITTIIWAMGHRYDYSLVHLPVFDEYGYPVTQAGMTDFPGLYFAGLPWQPMMRNGLLLGVGEAARAISEKISVITRA